MDWVDDFYDEPAVESCSDCRKPGCPDEGVAEHCGVAFLRLLEFGYGSPDTWLCPRCYRNRVLERKYAEAMAEKASVAPTSPPDHS